MCRNIKHLKRSLTSKWMGANWRWIILLFWFCFRANLMCCVCVLSLFWNRQHSCISNIRHFTARIMVLFSTQYLYGIRDKKHDKLLRCCTYSFFCGILFNEAVNVAIALFVCDEFVLISVWIFQRFVFKFRNHYVLKSLNIKHVLCASLFTFHMRKRKYLSLLLWSFKIW